MKARIFIGEPCTGKTRVAQMISEYVGQEKTVWVSGRDLMRNKEYLPMFLSKITIQTQLLVVDDCPPNFDFSLFANIENVLGQLCFKIEVEKRGYNRKEYMIPQVIFTVGKLYPSKFLASTKFNECFEYVAFPLNQQED